MEIVLQPTRHDKEWTPADEYEGAARMIATALGWLGRQGTRAIAAIVFIAIALPPIDRLLKPYVTEAIFALLAIAFLRLDLALLRQQMQRPAIVLIATAWTMVIVPAVIGAICLAVGLD